MKQHNDIPLNMPLERMVRLLPMPLRPLQGQDAGGLSLPNRIVSFYHSSAEEMNKPKEGRALHHRYVLMLALETSVTVCVDDQAIHLNAGEGLLVLPFQFHNYIQPEQDKITWMFVTFEMPNGNALAPLRYRPFKLSPPIRQLLQEFLLAFLSPGQEELTVVLCSLLLIRIRQSSLLNRETVKIEGMSNLIGEINRLALAKGEMPSVKEMANTIGISASHLRARFRASCGVSLGRHLRKLRLEKACSLLRFSSLRVSDIAEQCGFSSIFTFSRSFRIAYGIPPLSYRNSMDGDAPSKKRQRETPREAVRKAKSSSAT